MTATRQKSTSEWHAEWIAWLCGWEQARGRMKAGFAREGGRCVEEFQRSGRARVERVLLEHDHCEQWGARENHAIRYAIRCLLRRKT